MGEKVNMPKLSAIDKKLDELMADTVNKLIKMIEKDDGNWEQPWQMLRLGLHHQAANQTPYLGANQLSLAITSVVNNFEDSRWATYKGWQALAAQVKKGERGTSLIRWNVIFHCDTHGRSMRTDCGCATSHRVLFASSFTVFNAQQVDGAPVVDDVSLDSDFDFFTPADDFVELCEVDVVSADASKAFYTATADIVNMPPVNAFESTQGYYSTLFHEMIHWTGHDSRLDRSTRNKFGDSLYAGEELVAELGSAFLAAHFSIEAVPHPEHAKYLASWLKGLKESPRRLYTAARDAQNATKFLLELADANRDVSLLQTEDNVLAEIPISEKDAVSA